MRTLRGEKSQCSARGLSSQLISIYLCTSRMIPLPRLFSPENFRIVLACLIAITQTEGKVRAPTFSSKIKYDIGSPHDFVISWPKSKSDSVELIALDEPVCSTVKGLLMSSSEPVLLVEAGQENMLESCASLMSGADIVPELCWPSQSIHEAQEVS